ncbi:MAG: hypothetical protein M0R46_10000 [Candidatus Muirbacterium halophilum]|nr:hypothetical protein [Candidatus Muirbacterium halophilum]
MSIKENIENIVSKGINYLLNFKNYIEIDDTLTVDKLDVNDPYALYINSKSKVLYCIQLASAGNLENFVDHTTINKIFEAYNYAENSRLTQVFYKQSLSQKNLLFSSNKDLLSVIAKKLEAEFLEYDEMIDTIYQLFLNNSFFVEKKQIHSNFNLSENLNYEVLSRSFNVAVKDSIYNNFSKINIFQGYKARKRSNNIQLSRLFRLDWEGVIFNTIEINKEVVKNLITIRKNQAFIDGKEKPFKELLYNYDNNNIELAVLNSVIFFSKGDLNSSIEIGSILGIDYFEKFIDKEKYLKFTPLIARDNYFDMIIDKDFLYGFIGSAHKKNVDNADFYGTDINGAFWNYRFDKTTNDHYNKSSDFWVLGTKGSGKTTFVNAMLSQVLNLSFDKEKEFKLGNFGDAYYKNKIRYFDIKKSGLLLANLLSEKAPATIKFMNTSISDFSFNPVNIRKYINDDGLEVIDENELTMNILLLSIILESKNKDGKAGLNASEQAMLKNIIVLIYNNNLYDCDYIEALEKQNPKIFKELINLGYSKLDNLKNVKEKDYDFLKVPTLNTAVKNVKAITQNKQNENQSSIAYGLLTKLELIESIGIFNGHDKFNFEDANFIHIDFDPIKDLDEYVPVFLSLFMRMYRFDKFIQEQSNDKNNRPYITYIMEEAYNVTSQQSFEPLLAKFINEARSYRIKIGFITQLIEHIPPNIIKQVANKFFLFPSKNQRKHLIDGIKDVLQLDNQTVELMNNTPEFGVVLVNEHSSSSFKLDISKEEVELYGQAQ